MPKNSSGGNKAKKQGNKNTANKRDETRPLKLKGNEQQYGKCVCIYGGSPCYVGVRCEDGLERRVVLRGKMRNIRVQVEDYLLVLINSTTEGECEFKYFHSEVAKLKAEGHIDDRVFDQQGGPNDGPIMDDEDNDSDFGEDQIDNL